MTEKKMENPYYTLGEAFVASVVAGNRGKITGNQIGLSDRLREYAYFVQENAVEAGDALLVNDLLDAARQLQRQAPAIQPQRMREQIIEACAKIAEPWAGFWPQDDATATDKAIIEVRTEIAKKIRELAHTRHDDPPQQMPDSLREVLKQHWLTAIHCDHKDGTDRPGCYCATWYCEPQPTVGGAVDKWIDHVIEQLSLARPDLSPAEKTDGSQS